MNSSCIVYVQYRYSTYVLPLLVALSYDCTICSIVAFVPRVVQSVTNCISTTSYDVIQCCTFPNQQQNKIIHHQHSTMNDDSRASLQDTKQSSDFPFVKNNLILRVRPIKDVRDLSIVWSLDSTRLLYRNNPCRLIGFLLGTKLFVLS